MQWTIEIPENISFKNEEWFMAKMSKAKVHHMIHSGIAEGRLPCRRRKLLQMVRNGGADDCTFTDGLGSFFKWSSMVMTLMEHSPKSKKTSSSDKNKNNSKNDTSRLVIPPLMRWVIKGPSQNNCVVWYTEVADGTTRVT